MKKSLLEIDLVKPLRALVGAMFLVIITVTCVQVACRYIFNNSLVWSEELVRFMVIWMCMLGAAVESFDDKHMAINTFVGKLPVTGQFILYSLRQLAIILFSVICAASSVKLIKAAWFTYSGALGIPMGMWRAAGTVGLVLISILTAIRYIKDCKKFKNGQFSLADENAG